jgi:uncharacterized protein (TIGR00251 family)
MEINDIIKDGSLEIIVKPNSSKSEITGYDEIRKALNVSIKGPPENNKANIEVIKLFSRLSGKKVKIITGMTSKKKVLRFE